MKLSLLPLLLPLYILVHAIPTPHPEQSNDHKLEMVGYKGASLVYEDAPKDEATKQTVYTTAKDRDEVKPKEEEVKPEVKAREEAQQSIGEAKKRAFRKKGEEKQPQFKEMAGYGMVNTSNRIKLCRTFDWGPEEDCAWFGPLEEGKCFAISSAKNGFLNDKVESIHMPLKESKGWVCTFYRQSDCGQADHVMAITSPGIRNIESVYKGRYRDVSGFRCKFIGNTLVFGSVGLPHDVDPE